MVRRASVSFEVIMITFVGEVPYHTPVYVSPWDFEFGGFALTFELPRLVVAFVTLKH